MSAPEAAALLGTDRTMISNVEAGRVGISEERLRRLACNYGCPDQAFVEALAEMAGRRRKQWWEEYRGALPAGFLDIAELEFHATRLRTAQTIHMPGLLQTEDHARALFELVVPPLPRLEVELRVAHRLKRQTIFEREDPPQYTAIIHEAALRMQFGSRKIARAQLEYLLEATERENVTVLVIPFDAGGFPGAGQSVLYAHGVVPQLDTVQLDTSHGPVFLDSQMQLAIYRSRLDVMAQSALDPKASREFIHTVAQEM